MKKEENIDMAGACPMRLEKPLLSTDGSEFSEGAIKEGIKLAKTCGGGKLSALYVIEFNPEFEALAPNAVEKAELDARYHMHFLKDRAEKEGVSCEIIIRRSESPYTQIIKEAERLGSGVIIMGRRGRTGLKRLMMGSVTAKVIGHSKCDVLVVPRAANILYKNILAATDGSRYGRAAGSEAVGIAKRSGGRLIALCAVHTETSAFVASEMQKGLIADMELKEAQKNINYIEELAKKEGVAFEGIVSEGRPYEVIVETAKEKKADLIVIGCHGRTGIERLLMGSVTERVIGLSECAVLVSKC